MSSQPLNRIDVLAPLIGTWRMDVEFPDGRQGPPRDVGARTVFEYSAGVRVSRQALARSVPAGARRTRDHHRRRERPRVPAALLRLARGRACLHDDLCRAELDARARQARLLAA